MATPNVGILTIAGKALIDKVNSGQAKISFSKVVFSSMDNSQLSDTQVKALTAIYPQEVVVSPPETTLDTTSGETRIRATGTNKQLADGVYVKTYGVFAKDETGNEVLYGVTVSPNPNYFPAYDGVTPQAVTYSYKTVIQETSNITMTNSNDVYVTQEDLTEAIGKIPQPDLSNYATQQQLATKADTSAIDPSVMVNKRVLTADDDLFSLGVGTYYVWGKTPKNYPTSVVPWGRVVVKMLEPDGINVDTKLVEVFDTSNNHWINIHAGYPLVWSGWEVPNATTMATKSDVTTAVSTATANMVDSSKPTNFTAGLKSGGVDVATAADLKSVKDSAWRQLDNKYITVYSGTLSSETTILFRIDQTAKRLYLQGSILVSEVNAVTAVDIDFSSVVKTISPDTKYPISYAGDNPFSTYSATVISNKLRVATNSSGISLIANRSNSKEAPYVTYDELV